MGSSEPASPVVVKGNVHFSASVSQKEILIIHFMRTYTITEGQVITDHVPLPFSESTLSGVPFKTIIFSIILFIYVFSILYVYFRGKEKYKFIRHLTDNWTIFLPINAFMYLFSYRYACTPYISLDHFPQLNPVRDQWETIKSEALKLYHEGHITSNAKPNEVGFYDIGFYSFLRTGWNRFYLKWYNTEYPSAASLAPKTVSILKGIRDVKAAMFALLPSGAKLVRHRDPYAGSLRYHLGLVTPNSDKCRIYVDGQPYSWRDGEAVMFDETFLHYAHNETSVDRIILFLDIERPMRFRIASKLNHFLGKYLVSMATAPNVKGEKIGVLNRLFPVMYHFRLFCKRIKAWNKKIYYLLKYSIMLGSLALLLFWVVWL